MKIAIAYNRDSKNVINLFGMPNQEKIGLKTIQRITAALKDGGHHVVALEADKDLIDRLEDFMPQVLKGERPGMVFNVSYGLQGQARYTHVPGILEMVGIPYVGSGPLAHSLALDKVVSKMIFRQNGLPTPDFAVLDGPDFEIPELKFPLIVKPKNEAVSMGLKVVHNEEELRDGVRDIFEMFNAPVLAEQYIEGREVNVGLLGNNPPEVLPPAEILFGEGGPRIYTYEDKTRKSGREVGVECPARIGEALTAKAQDLALRAFKSLGCYDCARVDMRLDSEENLYILEVNSLPSMGEHGSYTHAAAAAGLDYSALVNRLVEVASARYFGTPQPPVAGTVKKDPAGAAFAFITRSRDRIEKRVGEWVARTSPASDPVGLRNVIKELDSVFDKLGLKPVRECTDERSAWSWATPKGLDGGTLLVCHADVPLDREAPRRSFRRSPEWLYGEGIGCSRAPLTCMEYSLRALRHVRRLRGKKLGVLCYADESRDCRYSEDIIRAAAARAKRMLVLRPGNVGNHAVVKRRGLRKYRFTAEGKPLRLGQHTKRPGALAWTCAKLAELAKLGSRKQRVSVAATRLKTESFPLLLPHKVGCTLLVSYGDEKQAAPLEERIRGTLGRDGMKWELEMISDRPPMKDRRNTLALAKSLARVAEAWDLPFSHESSAWPSAAGLAPARTAVLCGLGPVAQDLYTPQEAVQRISLIQRTLLLTEFLLQE